MRSPIALLGLVVAACASPAPTPAPGPDLAAEERAIRSADSVWMSAVARHDAAVEGTVYADDGIAYREMADPLVGPAAYQAFATKYYAENPKVEGGWITRSITVAASGDLAVQTGTYTDSNGGPKGNQTRHGNFITVWKKVNGQWKVAADIGQPFTPAKP